MYRHIYTYMVYGNSIEVSVFVRREESKLEKRL